MDYKYKASTVIREALPRNARAKNAGTSVTGERNIIIGTGNEANTVSHEHSNLGTLERISTDENSYMYLSHLEDEIDEETETETGEVILTRGKIKAGYADVAADLDLAEDSNVLKKLTERFLRKDIPDIAQGIITFLKGIRIGRFVSGWIGSGAAITVDSKTGKTRLEVDEVLARDRFETMEFRFNRVDVIDGEQWSTFAYGKIKSVDTENQTVCLDLVDGELMSSHVNDLCRGIFHNLTSANAAGNKPDDCGFYTHAGFSTSYFTPTELLEDGSGFKYALRPGTTQHPCAGMKFAAYGNLTDPARRMSKVTNTRHSLYLKEVATWQINPDRHYGAAYGDLTGITINGVEFNGYSSFQTNGYFKGHIEFLPDQMEELKGDGGYAVSLTTYDAVVAVDSLGRIDSSVYDIINVVDGEELVTSGDSEVTVTRYKIQTAIQAFKGAEPLSWAATPGKGSYSASFIAGGCTCVLDEGVLTVTGITEDKAEVTIEVNCEGEVAFTKNFTLTRVYGGVNANGVSYVFKQSATQPATPTGTDIIPPGWSDGPSAEGKWWMSKGDINGTTGKAGNWTIPIQVTGQDGNGMYYEYAVNSSETDAPASGWTSSVPSVASGQYLWMRWGKIVPPATYPASWDGTARVTGEKGEQGQPGIQGIQGEKGEQGLEGPAGNNGQTTYFHIKYSYSANGNPMTEDSSAPYIGTYVDYNPTDSSYYFYYTWRRFQGLQGDKGEQGIPGVNGDDGLTYYTHIKYSDDGGRTFTSNNGETSGSYIGFCVDLNVNDPSYVGAYKWSKIKGEDGQDGQDANLLDWVEEWNGTKTTVNGTSVLSPKAYFGTVSGGKLSTGVLLGNNVYESGKAGVYGFKNGELVFKLNSAGENIIGGWTIESNRIKSDNAGEIYIYHNGGRFMTIGGEGNALISGRCDGGTGLSLYTQSSSGTAISITAQTGAKAISSYGNVELIARNTEVIRINGLCVNVRTLTSSGSVGSNDDFIKINTTADITVSLPTGSAYTGKIVYMKQISTGNYTVTGGIRRSDQRATDSSFQFTDNKMRGFIFDGSYWNEIFMSVR
ncbi:collagen-like triple helix repeat-containing protein [Phocaeicola faecalis]